LRRNGAATLPEKGGENELQRHFIFIIEYIFTIMKSEEEAKTVLLLDMRDVSMKVSEHIIRYIII